LTGTWVALSFPALLTSCQNAWEERDGATDFVTLAADEASVLEAMVAQLIPTTDTPGAREAGVIHFLDAALGTFFAPMLDPTRAGIEAVSVKAAELYGGESSFTELDDAQQIAVLKEIEDEGFFGAILFTTVAGMFSHPDHGGNKDKVGWSLIGFDDQHAWAPPFGHYDAEYNQSAGGQG